MDKDVNWAQDSLYGMICEIRRRLKMEDDCMVVFASPDCLMWECDGYKLCALEAGFESHIRSARCVGFYPHDLYHHYNVEGQRIRLLFRVYSIDADCELALNAGQMLDSLRLEFNDNGVCLSNNLAISAHDCGKDYGWRIVDGERVYFVYNSGFVSEESDKWKKAKDV